MFCSTIENSSMRGRVRPFLRREIRTGGLFGKKQRKRAQRGSGSSILMFPIHKNVCVPQNLCSSPFFSDTPEEAGFLPPTPLFPQNDLLQTLLGFLTMHGICCWYLKASLPFDADKLPHAVLSECTKRTQIQTERTQMSRKPGSRRSLSLVCGSFEKCFRLKFFLSALRFFRLRG